MLAREILHCFRSELSTDQETKKRKKVNTILILAVDVEL